MKNKAKTSRGYLKTRRKSRRVAAPAKPAEIKMPWWKRLVDRLTR